MVSGLTRVTHPHHTQAHARTRTRTDSYININTCPPALIDTSRTTHTGKGDVTSFLAFITWNTNRADLKVESPSSNNGAKRLSRLMLHSTMFNSIMVPVMVRSNFWCALFPTVVVVLTLEMLQHVKYGCAKVSRGEIVGVREEKGARVLPDDRSLTDT